MQNATGLANWGSGANRSTFNPFGARSAATAAFSGGGAPSDEDARHRHTTTVKANKRDRSKRLNMEGMACAAGWGMNVGWRSRDPLGKAQVTWKQIKRNYHSYCT